MDIQALRRNIEAYIKERDKLNEEIDAFILSNMDEIRDILIIYESCVFEVSKEELVCSSDIIYYVSSQG